MLGHRRRWPSSLKSPGTKTAGQVRTTDAELTFHPVGAAHTRSSNSPKRHKPMTQRAAKSESRLQKFLTVRLLPNAYTLKQATIVWSVPIIRSVHMMGSDASESPAEIARRFREQLDACFRGPLMSYFYKRVRDYSEAEDLTQEVFLRLVTQAKNFTPANAEAYVFTVAANLLRDQARRAATHHLHAHDTLDQSHRSKISAGLVEEIGPERVLLGRESLQIVLGALAELDDRTRNIFILFQLERMRQREIAEIYGMTVGSVEKRVLKALTHLRVRLEENEKKNL